MCINMGMTKASVLPLPVLAMPTTSRPNSPMGTACAWIGVGSVNPSLSSTCGGGATHTQGKVSEYTHRRAASEEDSQSRHRNTKAPCVARDHGVRA
jgi:hypothetical protein